jgi:hypothetical protein
MTRRRVLGAPVRAEHDVPGGSPELRPHAVHAAPPISAGQGRIPLHEKDPDVLFPRTGGSASPADFKGLAPEKTCVSGAAG